MFSCFDAAACAVNGTMATRLAAVIVKIVLRIEISSVY
jgi:hypothetical protein